MPATYTPNLNLWKGVRGDEDWDVALNANADLVDSIAPISVVTHGAATGASAADNTTAFDAAIAEAISTGAAVYVPNGSWNLNALADVDGSLRLFGAGRGTKLIFNTAADAIHIHPAASAQADTFHIHHLAFDNVTNVPASFIRNQNALNVRLDHLYFSDCAVTYCIDNENGYGLKVSDSVFSDITGSGLRLQDDGVGATKYSYAVILDGCDFTRLSGDGIDIDGTEGLTIIGGIIESCTGYGIRTNYRVGAQIASVQSWGINIHGTYFEGNGTDIKCETAATYSSRITMISPILNGTTAISLGTYGRLVIVGGQIPGAATCTISGSSDARVALIGHVNSNFTQSGTFQWNDLGQYYEAAGTPEWVGGGSNPVVNSGTFTSHMSRSGHRATLEMYLSAAADTTFGSGTYYFGDALLTAIPATHPNEAVGTAWLYDATGAFSVGAVRFLDADTLGIEFATGTVSATAPWTWAQDDQIRISITYRC